DARVGGCVLPEGRDDQRGYLLNQALVPGRQVDNAHALLLRVMLPSEILRGRGLTRRYSGESTPHARRCGPHASRPARDEATDPATPPPPDPAYPAGRSVGARRARAPADGTRSPGWLRQDDASRGVGTRQRAAGRLAHADLRRRRTGAL